jgi:squalene-hopene/tetraprenyl-beta-curcumene cyclase
VLEDRHAVLVEEVWGAGADCDVIPNLLYALELYDAARFAEVTQRGATYLEREQRDDGTWTSRWYAGPYYAIYVCLRMFAAVRPRSPAVPRALAALRDTQRRDGGWGLHAGASDPLMTALALLGLAAAQPAHGEPADRARAARGIEHLRCAMAGDGGWPAQELIFKGLRAFHGSRTLTTTFALKAALAWQDQRAEASIARTA